MQVFPDAGISELRQCPVARCPNKGGLSILSYTFQLLYYPDTMENMSKELKFSLVKSFISKQTFRLLYSSLHQCNAELQNKNRRKY